MNSVGDVGSLRYKVILCFVILFLGMSYGACAFFLDLWHFLSDNIK